MQDLEQRSGDITYGQFAQLYRSLMYSAQKTVHEPLALPCPCPNSSLYLLVLLPCFGDFGCHAIHYSSIPLP